MGQIATFMDSLHLSYKEVFEEIPYRNLTIMSKDKLRPVYGTKVEKSTGREVMLRRQR